MSRVERYEHVRMKCKNTGVPNVPAFTIFNVEAFENLGV